MSAPDRAMYFESGKLWSLWDMLELKARPFVKAVHAIGYMVAMINVMHDHRPELREQVMGSKVRPDFRREMKVLRDSALTLGASSTSREAGHILKRLRREDFQWVEFSHLLEGLSRMLTGEIQEAKLFVIEPSKVGYYNLAAGVFGMEAVVAFPKAEYDLEEAGKCLALARNTACVYHLMKAMETVLQALCERLGMTNVDKRWGFLLADIDQALKGLRESDSKAAWSLVRTNLWHVKETWRNDTMHPGDKYTDAEAAEVLEAVRVFIRSLSTLAAAA